MGSQGGPQRPGWAGYHDEQGAYHPPEWELEDGGAGGGGDDGYGGGHGGEAEDDGEGGWYDDDGNWHDPDEEEEQEEEQPPPPEPPVKEKAPAQGVMKGMSPTGSNIKMTYTGKSTTWKGKKGKKGKQESMNATKARGTHNFQTVK